MQEKIDKSSEQLLNLVGQYGSMDDIPDEELEKMNYSRMHDGKIVKSELMDDVLSKMEYKKDNLPFEKIEVKTLVKEAQFKLIEENATIKIAKYIDKFETDLTAYDWHKIAFEKDDPYWYFMNEFECFIKKYQRKPPIKKDEVDDWIRQLIDYSHFSLIEAYDRALGGKHDYAPGEINDSFGLSDFIVEDPEQFDKEIPIENVEKLYEKLNRMSGILLDEDFYRNENYNNAKEDISGIHPEADDYFRDLGISTVEQGSIIYISEYFFSKGLDAIANLIKSCETYSQLALQLHKIKPEYFPSFTKIKELKKKMKGASVDEKRELSQELALAQQKKRDDKRLIQGLLNTVEPEKYQVNLFRHFLKKMKSFITVATGKPEETVLYLDARLNSELDRDPGVVSGDCTQGKPLPFDHPEIPMYNVKVFKGDNEHIGNIYLLKTIAGESGDKEVWHLEAIQVPSGIDWNESVETLIKSIGEEAKRKGITYITVNSELPHISNYDYIQNAVYQYLCNTKYGEIAIDRPRNPNPRKYSDFQGDGEVLIIWKKDE